MNQLDRLERWVQQLIERPFNHLFRTGLHPTDLADSLLTAAEESRQNGSSANLIPNHYQVMINPADYVILVEKLDCDAIVTELYNHLVTQAAEAHYQFGGTLHILLDQNETVSPGQIEIKTDYMPALQ
jgi:hypothetical protein